MTILEVMLVMHAKLTQIQAESSTDTSEPWELRVLKHRKGKIFHNYGVLHLLCSMREKKG